MLFFENKAKINEFNIDIILYKILFFLFIIFQLLNINKIKELLLLKLN